MTGVQTCALPIYGYGCAVSAWCGVWHCHVAIFSFAATSIVRACNRCDMLAGPRHTALPAAGKLSFQQFAAVCATPGFAEALVRLFALQKLPQQSICTLEFVVIDDPHLAQAGRQLAKAAQQEFAAHDGGDSMGFKVAADQMCFSGVTRGVQWCHVYRVARMGATRVAGTL